MTSELEEHEEYHQDEEGYWYEGGEEEELQHEGAEEEALQEEGEPEVADPEAEEAERVSSVAPEFPFPDHREVLHSEEHPPKHVELHLHPEDSDLNGTYALTESVEHGRPVYKSCGDEHEGEYVIKFMKHLKHRGWFVNDSHDDEASYAYCMDLAHNPVNVTAVWHIHCETTGQFVDDPAGEVWVANDFKSHGGNSAPELARPHHPETEILDKEQEGCPPKSCQPKAHHHVPPPSPPSSGRVDQKEGSAGVRKLQGGRQKKGSASATEYDPEICPKSIEVQMDPPSEADGTYLLQESLVVNKRLVYKSGPNIQGGPFFFVYLDDNCWVLQEHDDGTHDKDDVLLICKDPAPHPAAVRRVWQILGEDGEFQEDPGVRVWERNKNHLFYERVLRKGLPGFSVSGDWSGRTVGKVLVQSMNPQGWAKYEYVCIGDELVSLDGIEVRLMSKGQFEERLNMRPLRVRFSRGNDSWNSPLLSGTEAAEPLHTFRLNSSSEAGRGPFSIESEASRKKDIINSVREAELIRPKKKLKPQKRPKRDMVSCPVDITDPTHRVGRDARNRSASPDGTPTQNKGPQGYYNKAFEWQQRVELWKSEHRREDARQEVRDCTFHPQQLTWKKILADNSDGAKSSAEGVIQRLYDDSIAKNTKKMKKLIETRDKQLMKPCTFAPTIHPYQNSDAIEGLGDTWLDRLYDDKYHAKKQKKLEALKAKNDQKEMKECTFAPRVNPPNKGASCSSRSPSPKGRYRWPNDQDFVARQDCREYIRQLKYNLMYTQGTPDFCPPEMNARSLQMAATARARLGCGPVAPIAHVASAPEWRVAAAASRAVASSPKSLDTTLSEPELETSPLKPKGLQKTQNTGSIEKSLSETQLPPNFKANSPPPSKQGRDTSKPKGKKKTVKQKVAGLDPFKESKKDVALKPDKEDVDDEEQRQRDLEEIAAKEKVMEHITKKLNQCEQVLLKAQKTQKDPGNNVNDLQKIIAQKLARIEQIEKEKLAAEQAVAPEPEAIDCSPAKGTPPKAKTKAKAPAAKAREKSPPPQRSDSPEDGTTSTRARAKKVASKKVAAKKGVAAAKPASKAKSPPPPQRSKGP